MTRGTLAVAWLTRTQVLWAMGILGSITLALVCLVLLRWRWGHAKAVAKNPMTKYIVLSVIAHLILAVAAYFAHVRQPQHAEWVGPDIIVQLVDAGATDRVAPPERSDPSHLPVVPAAVPQRQPTQAQSPAAERAEAEPEFDPPADSLPRNAEVSRNPEPEIPAEQTLDGPTAAAKLLPSEGVRPSTDPSGPSPGKGGPLDKQTDKQTDTQTDKQIDKQMVEPAAAPRREHPPPRDPPSSLAEGGSPADAPEAALSAPEDHPLRSRGQAKELESSGSLRDTGSPPPSRPRPLPAKTRPQRRTPSPSGELARGEISPTAPQMPRREDGSVAPPIFRDRWAVDRLTLVRSRGGSRETEAAVLQSLQWLAAAQAADGRWDASRYGGGRLSPVGGQDRQQAGREADSGITGLAVLAFLGSGHTHREGRYRDVLQKGLDYLLRAQQQHSDGRLVGRASTYAAMYCHGIATLALSEAYVLTGDPSLREPLRRAVAFTLAAQHPVTGGWRYLPRQTGDTSQLGWQLMALTSAHYAGEPIPSRTWAGANRFLNSVSWGRFGGLASYRPGERPSTPMTAEALLCRLFLQTPTDHPLVREAADDLLRELPGERRVNFYYWYYGTLALYHLQDHHWDVWNRAVKRELVSRQRNDGPLTGSWDPDSVWGASGGRVYTTALATLTLEVYYRYRPLAQPVPARTAWRSR